MADKQQQKQLTVEEVAQLVANILAQHGCALEARVQLANGDVQITRRVGIVRIGEDEP